MTKRIFNHYMNKKDKILHAQGSDIEYLICLLYVYEIRLFKYNDAFSLNCKYYLHLHKNFFETGLLDYRGDGAVGQSVGPASGRLGIRIQAATDLSRKKLHCQTLGNRCECHGSSEMTNYMPRVTVGMAR